MFGKSMEYAGKRDEEIEKYLKEGNELGLSLFKEKYERLLRYVISNILAGHEADIEECLNDTYYNVWKSIDAFDSSKASLKNYSVVIARNLAKNRLRAIKGKEGHMESIDINDADEFIRGEGGGIEDIIINKQDIEFMQQMISELKDKYRKVLVLRYYYMMDSESIAKKLGITVSAVNNRMYKAKKMLKAKVRDRYGR